MSAETARVHAETARVYAQTARVYAVGGWCGFS